MMRSCLSIKQKTCIALFFIVLLGYILRFYNFPTSVRWSPDTGRDFLAGKLIATYDYTLHYGHWNSGIEFTYPSHYYNLFSFLHNMLSSTEAIIFFFVFVQSGAIILFFFIARNLFSPTISLLIALLYAIAPRVIEFALWPFSSYFGLLLFLPALYFVTKKRPTTIDIAASAFFLILSSTVFYATLLCVPFFIVWLFKKNTQKAHNARLIIFFIGSLVLFYFLFFFQLITRGHLRDLLYIKNNIQIVKQFSFRSFLDAFNKEVQYIFPVRPLLGASALGVLCLFLKFKKINIIPFLYFIGTFIFFVFLSQLKPDPLPEYLIILTPLTLLAIGFLLEKALSRSIPIVIVVSICIIYAMGAYKPLHNLTYMPSYTTYRKIAQYVERAYPHTTVQMTQPHSLLFYEGRTIWYFLTERGQYLLSDTHNQIELLPKYNQTIYLCEEFSQESLASCDPLAHKLSWRFIEYKQFDTVYLAIYSDK